MSKVVLNKQETVYLRLRTFEVERVTVIKFKVNSAGDDGTSYF